MRTLILLALLAIASALQAQTPGLQASPGDQTRPPACQASSLTDLPRCVAVGERIRVTTLSDGRRRTVTGVFLGYSRSQLVLGLGGERFEFLDDANVEQVVSLDDRTGWKGPVIGAAVGAALLATLRGRAKGPGEEHLPGPVYFGVLGGLAGSSIGIGATENEPVPLLDRRRGPLSPPGDSALPVVVPAPQVTAALESLVSRLTVADRLVIRDAARADLAGRYVGIEDGSVLLRVGDSIRRLPGPDLFFLAHDRTHHPSLKKGALVGGAIGLVLTGLIVAEDRATHSLEPLTFSEGMGGTLFCAGVGAVVTRFVGREREVLLVRPALTPTAQVSPPQPGVHWTFSFR